MEDRSDITPRDCTEFNITENFDEDSSLLERKSSKYGSVDGFDTYLDDDVKSTTTGDDSLL